MLAPESVYRDREKRSISILFDIADGAQRELLRAMHVAFGEYSEIEALSDSVFVLSCMPGAAKRLLP